MTARGEKYRAAHLSDQRRVDQAVSFHIGNELPESIILVLQIQLTSSLLPPLLRQAILKDLPDF